MDSEGVHITELSCIAEVNDTRILFLFFVTITMKGIYH